MHIVKASTGKNVGSGTIHGMQMTLPYQLLPNVPMVALHGVVSSGNSACTSFGLIHPDAGFETRWTPREQRDVLAHDSAHQALCGR